MCVLCACACCVFELRDMCESCWPRKLRVIHSLVLWFVPIDLYNVIFRLMDIRADDRNRGGHVNHAWIATVAILAQYCLSVRPRDRASRLLPACLLACSPAWR